MKTQEKDLLYKNESGAVLIIALVLLMGLTLLGLASSRTSSTEVLVAGNEKTYKELLYLTEAVAMENAQTIQNASDDINTSGVSWMLQTLPEPYKIKAEENWAGAENSTLATSRCDLEFISHFQGISSGESLDMAKESNLYTYSLYSRGIMHNDPEPDEEYIELAEAYIEIGFKRAF